MSDHVTWAGVVYALIITLPAIIGAVVAFSNRKQLATGEPKTLGQIATDVNAQLVTGNEKTLGDMVTEIHGHESAQSTPFETHHPEKPPAE